MPKSVVLIAALVFVLPTLAACGGGGGGGDSPQPQPPTPDTTMNWDDDNWDEKDWQ